MNKTRYVAQAGMIAAVYAAITLVTLYLPFSLGFGLVQFRLSEAVTVLAVFTPAAIPGLTLGSVIANALNPQATWPFAAFDVVFGSLGTLLGAVWMWRFRGRTAIALAGPVVTNALIVAAYLPTMMKAFGLQGLYNVFGLSVAGPWLPMYLVGVVAVAIGQSAVLFTLGWGLLAALRRLGLGDMLRI